MQQISMQNNAQEFAFLFILGRKIGNLSLKMKCICCLDTLYAHGHVEKPKFKSHFNTDCSLAIPRFVIRLDCGETLFKCIHFSNNNTKDTYQGPSKLFNLSHINKNFHNLYILGPNIQEMSHLSYRKEGYL
jgi:hypothetical protein